MMMLALFIAGNIVAQNPNTGNSKGKIEPTNQSDKVTGLEKDKASKVEAAKETNKENVATVNGSKKDKEGKVKDDDHDQEMLDEDKGDKEHVDFDKDKEMKEKENNGNAYGKYKEGLTKEEFADLRSNKSKDRKEKKDKKSK